MRPRSSSGKLKSNISYQRMNVILFVGFRLRFQRVRDDQSFTFLKFRYLEKVQGLWYGRARFEAYENGNFESSRRLEQERIQCFHKAFLTSLTIAISDGSSSCNVAGLN